MLVRHVHVPALAILLLALPAAASFGNIAALFPSDGPEDCEWHLRAIRVDRAWALLERVGRGLGEGVVVGVPDTGYVVHPEVPIAVGATGGVALEGSWDFVHRLGPARDDLQPHDGLVSTSAHAVGLMSLLLSPRGKASGTEGRCGASGVAPASRIVPAVVSHGVIAGARPLAQAIHQATERGVHIIAIAQGMPQADADLHAAVRDAVQRGVIVIAAAGNGTPFVVYPAAFPEVIAVAATDVEDAPFPFTSNGPELDIAAPGARVYAAFLRRDVLSSALHTEVRTLFGTTPATAQVAGVAALWLAYHGRAELLERYGAARLASLFRHLLQRSARRPARYRATMMGAGIVDAEALLLAPLPHVDEVP
ncbi:MAG: hypothetical protein A2138_13500 [Deltaproteobacteria bacterium RBG_16_71_12]|nr:MAG: hypothetical protein A2138_13500 [Deltaproteobacteria bacterium RBG_16_71_12]